MILIDILNSEKSMIEFHIFMGLWTLAFLMIFLFSPKGCTIVLNEEDLKIIVLFNGCCCHYTKETYKYDIIDRIVYKRVYRKDTYRLILVKMNDTRMSEYTLAEEDFTLEEMEYIQTIVNNHIQKMKGFYGYQNSDC